MLEKAKHIKLIIFDVDGVMTDGCLYLDDKGVETKRFYVPDGFGIERVLKTTIQIAIISGRKAKGVELRMKNLGIKHIFQGHVDKTAVYEDLLKKLNIKDSEVAHVGDDVPDIALFKRVGLAISVPNGTDEAKAAAMFMTTAKGGKGAVREVCDTIMRAQNLL